jgi:ferredoxin
MPTLHVDDREILVPSGIRLTIAIEEAGIEIGHRCGGRARCTTCRVVVHDGEPAGMTRAEHRRLAEAGLLGTHRLSCQLAVEADMRVETVMTKQNQPWADTGPALAPAVAPEERWFTRDELEALTER